MKQRRDSLLLTLTPGPWNCERHGSNWRITAQTAGEAGTAVAIATVTHPSEANAVLITAAPRMLDLLLRLSRCHEPMSAAMLQDDAHELIGEIENARTSWPDRES